MWIIKDDEVLNLELVEYFEKDICDSDDLFQLSFYRNGKEIAYFFFKSKEEINSAFNLIIGGLRTNVKVLDL